jgi:hypothetical protein
MAFAMSADLHRTFSFFCILAGDCAEPNSPFLVGAANFPKTPPFLAFALTKQECSHSTDRSRRGDPFMKPSGTRRAHRSDAGTGIAHLPTVSEEGSRREGTGSGEERTMRVLICYLHGIRMQRRHGKAFCRLCAHRVQ